MPLADPIPVRFDSEQLKVMKQLGTSTGHGLQDVIRIAAQLGLSEAGLALRSMQKIRWKINRTASPSGGRK